MFRVDEASNLNNFSASPFSKAVQPLEIYIPGACSGEVELGRLVEGLNSHPVFVDANLRN